MIKKAYVVVFALALIVMATNVFATNASVSSDAETEKPTEITSVVDTTELQSFDENTSNTHSEKETQPETIESEDTTSKVEESTTVYEETQVATYSEDDLYCLAVVVCREAGGESDEMQLLVANVVINRVNSSMYPNTIRGVLTQPHQYGTMSKNGISFPSWADSAIQNHCYEIARRILDGERFCPENVLFQAEFKQGSGVYKQIGNTYFCYY